MARQGGLSHPTTGRAGFMRIVLKGPAHPPSVSAVACTRLRREGGLWAAPKQNLENLTRKHGPISSEAEAICPTRSSPFPKPTEGAADRPPANVRRRGPAGSTR